MNWSRLWSKFCDSGRIVPNPSRSASRPWCRVGRSVMFLFDYWLAGRFGVVTDTLSPLSTENTHFPSTNILHPTSIDIPSQTSIDIPSQTSIDTESRDMVAPLILVRDNNGDLHDQEGHLRNAAVVKEEKLQEGDFEVESLMSFGGSQWCRLTPDHEHRSTYTSPNSRASIDDAYGVSRILQCREDSNSRGVHSKTPMSAQP
ncbi:hypothetical protein F2Q69_00012623 [Brassica cretica]|uniref:Uncharacterized protein n=1 Tax=Brassica cretica TaxID=69181 RepID=A0A8S9R659_BRACR|nr:hypothetical protein F2Q69_00012623 [Brassica cretica]